MSRYNVFNAQSGHSFGTYAGATGREAIEACIKDAGYDSIEDMERRLNRKTELQATELPSKLDTIVYLVEDGQIVETSIRDCGGYIDETTTPQGVGPRLHVRGAELWTWGPQGNFPHLVRSYDTEAEAQEALEESFVYDFWHADAITAFSTHEEAEKFLADEAP